MLLSGCTGTFDWAGEVGSHMPRRRDHGCSVGNLMLDRAGVCQKWLPFPLGRTVSGLHQLEMRVLWVGGGVLWRESCRCCGQFGCP